MESAQFSYYLFICKFFAYYGSCKFEKDCKFSHVKENKEFLKRIDALENMCKKLVEKCESVEEECKKLRAENDVLKVRIKETENEKKKQNNQNEKRSKSKGKKRC